MQLPVLTLVLNQMNVTAVLSLPDTTPTCSVSSSLIARTCRMMMPVSPHVMSEPWAEEVMKQWKWGKRTALLSVVLKHQNTPLYIWAQTLHK
jgi:hypothetical protein